MVSDQSDRTASTRQQELPTQSGIGCAPFKTQVQHEKPVVRKENSRSAYLPELDALRFLAFLLVYIHHSRFSLTNGNSAYEVLRQACGFGLCIFFLLSSYLITDLLLRERDTTGRIHLKAFYVRRILRIWPLYVLFILVCYVIGFWWRGHDTEAGRVVAMLAMSGNWYAVMYSYGTQSPLSPLWSISVEEQYYLIWPTLATFGKKVIVTSSITAASISLVTIYWLCLNHWHGEASLWGNSIVQFLFFAAGALLACILQGRTFQKSKLGAFSLIISGHIGFWLTERYFYLKDDFIKHPNPLGFTLGYLLVALMCTLVFLGFRLLPSVPSSIVYLGKISYGLYVFHAFSMLISGQIATAIHLRPLGRIIAPVLTVCLASLSYKYLEKPFLQLKERFTFIHSRPA